MSLTVLCSTNGFFNLVLRVFSFSFIFDHNCIFCVFILFPWRIITLLKSPVKGRNCRENAQCWKKCVSGYVICFS